MDTQPKRLIRVSPGVYRRGSKYIVRLRDAGGRQQQVTTNTRMEAEHLVRIALVEREQRRQRTELAAVSLGGAALRPKELAELRWDDVESPRGRVSRATKREA